MKFNYFNEMDVRTYHCRRNSAGLSPFSIWCIVFFAWMVMGPGNIVADCPNPIALWKLEESGAVPGFEDEVTPGYHIGVCRDVDGVSVCPEPEPARYGTGQRFYADGQLSGIDIPSSAIFNWDNTDSFSLSFWMKRDSASLTANEVIVGRDSTETDNDLHWWIGLHQSGAAGVNFEDINGVELHRQLKSDRLLTDNQWHYIVFVKDGVTYENRLYVDGHLEDEVVTTYYCENAFSADSTPVNIGWIKLDNKYQYKGMVDEIALYDMALPQWFIHDRYHADERYTGGLSDPCD